MPEAELKAAIEQAQAKIDTHRNRTRPRKLHEEPEQATLGPARMIDSLKQLGVAVQPVPNG